MATNNSKKLSPWVKDERGNVHNRLTVIEFVELRGEAIWLCRCECGNMTKVAGSGLRYNKTKSCGCGRKTQGGGWGTPEYTSWKEMKRRCYNPRYSEYHLYGGRGIAICGRWHKSFVAFLEDVGPKPFPEATIHRINNDGHYSCGQCEECKQNNWPMNCRWATKLEQGQNSRKVRLLTHDGETLCLRAWARRLGITHRTLSVRLKRGWPIEKALTTPAIVQARMLIYHGKTMRLASWAKQLGINPATLAWRIKQNWPEDRIFSHSNSH